MKRLLCLALALAAVLAGCGLVQRAAEQEPPLRLYYCYAEAEIGPYDGEDGALGCETDGLISTNATVDQVLSRYWKGPETETLRRPFPGAVAVEQWSLEDGCLLLTMSEETESLVGFDRTLLAACLVKTLVQLPSVESVVLTTGQEEIAGGIFNTALTAEDFLLVS